VNDLFDYEYPVQDEFDTDSHLPFHVWHFTMVGLWRAHNVWVLPGPIRILRPQDVVALIPTARLWPADMPLADCRTIVAIETYTGLLDEEDDDMPFAA